MSNGIPEFKQRRETDRQVSFGIYVTIFILGIILFFAVTVPTGIFWRMYRWRGAFGPEFPTHSFFLFAGWTLVILGIFLVLTVVFWWFQWQLYKRRNEHIDRIKRLKNHLSQWLEEKYQIDIDKGLKADTYLTIREQKRSTGYFVAWVVLGYLFPPVGYIFTLIAWYWLTRDWYFHEQAEIQFFQEISEKLKEKGISFDAEIPQPLPPRSMILYIILGIIPLINSIWIIWWSYVLFRDPNVHFDAHEHWETQLERVVAGETVTPQKSAMEILQERYARGEISKEEFETMKEDLLN